jgi:hypothetical protein
VHKELEELFDRSILGSDKVQELQAQGFRLARNSNSGHSELYIFEYGAFNTRGNLHYLEADSVSFKYCAYLCGLPQGVSQKVSSFVEGFLLGELNQYYDLEECLIFPELTNGSDLKNLIELEGPEIGSWVMLSSTYDTVSSAELVPEDLISLFRTVHESLDVIRGLITTKFGVSDFTLLDKHAAVYLEYWNQRRKIPRFDVWLDARMRDSGHELVPQVHLSSTSLSSEIVVRTPAGNIEISEYEQLMQDIWLRESD